MNGDGQTVTLPDGRQLGYLIVGAGKPVFHFHGFPSSRLDVLLLKRLARSQQLQFIGVDRPGFGLSTFASKRRLRDFAADLSFLANHLGVDTFALVGVSGGGHYAITCAALLATRVTRVMVISGLYLPLELSEMRRRNRLGFKLVTVPVVGAWLLQRFRNMIFEMAKNPDMFLKSKVGRFFLADLPVDDAKFFTSSTESRDVALRSVIEAFRQGSDGVRTMLQECNLLKQGWDVDLSKIRAGVVHIWHGTADTLVPVINAYKNAEAIPGAQVEIFENEGHFALFFNHLEQLGKSLSS